MVAFCGNIDIMCNKLSHTIRFDEDDKKRLNELADMHGHGRFQTEVNAAIKYYLKNHRVTLFLNRVQCALDAMSIGERTVTMAKIANLTGIELETE